MFSIQITRRDCEEDRDFAAGLLQLAGVWKGDGNEDLIVWDINRAAKVKTRGRSNEDADSALCLESFPRESSDIQSISYSHELYRLNLNAKYM